MHQGSDRKKDTKATNNAVIANAAKQSPTVNALLGGGCFAALAMTFFLLRASQFAMTGKEVAMTVLYFRFCSFYNSVNSDPFSPMIQRSKPKIRH
jgi:hypothetical protein